MNQREFVDALRVCVYESAITAMLETLSRPPGRRPSESLVVLSSWYNQLSASDRSHVQAIITETAWSALFGMLATLDGVRAINPPGEHIALELRSVSKDHVVFLNGPQTALLHDLFTEMVPPP